MSTVFVQTGSSLNVKPDERLDTATSPIFENEVQPYIESTDELIIDFSDIEYISSAGIRVLLVLQKQIEKRWKH